eukprot:3484891-Prymnesium_polylepis.1
MAEPDETPEHRRSADTESGPASGTARPSNASADDGVLHLVARSRGGLPAGRGRFQGSGADRPGGNHAWQAPAEDG